MFVTRRARRRHFRLGLRLAGQLASVPVQWLDALSPPEATVLMIGSFDGVHRGHQALIERVGSAAKRLSAPPWALSFFPHPLSVLRPGQEPPLMMSLEQRARTLKEFGMAEVAVGRFDAGFAELSADAFVDLVVERLRPRAIVVGFNFGYGKNRSGDAEHLKQAGEKHGYKLHIVEPLEIAGQPASSTRLREALRAGDLALTHEL